MEDIGLSTFTAGFSAEAGALILVLLVGEDQLSLELKLIDLSRLNFFFFPELSFGSFKLRLCLLFSSFFSPSGGLELSREIFCLKMAPTMLALAFTSLVFGTSSSELSSEPCKLTSYFVSSASFSSFLAIEAYFLASALISDFLRTSLGGLAAFASSVTLSLVELTVASSDFSS